MTFSQQFYDHFPPEVARAILEGRSLRVHAGKVSVVRDGGGYAFAFDTLPRDGRPEAWERTTQKIGKILKQEMDRLPAKTKQALIVFSAVTAEETPVLLIETWVRMGDGGGSLWTVTTGLSLFATTLPAVVRAAERAQKKALKEVYKL